MSFEHASVTKGVMMAYALTSLVGGVFDIKHYLHMQVWTSFRIFHAIIKYVPSPGVKATVAETVTPSVAQYWRLVTHHLAFSNSSDLLLAELILYNVSVTIERQFGSVKFASFAIVSALMSTTLEFASLILLHRVGLNQILPGPTAVVFSILYQWYRLVPSSYHFRIFGISLSNKSFTYVLASQLAFGHMPASLASACIGLLVGFIYRSEVINIKKWRVSPTLVRFSKRFLLPLIGSTRPPRRLNRARPDRPDAVTELLNEEIVTTSRPSTSTRPSAVTPAEAQGEAGNVVREWVNELTGRADAPAIRTPSEIEIRQLATMFPDASREVITRALQRSPNIEAAVEILLNAQ